MKTKPFTRRVGHTYSVDESKKIIAACANAADRLTVSHLGQFTFYSRLLMLNT